MEPLNGGTGDTIVARATPEGEGALGVIRLSGPGAIGIAGRFFTGKNLSEQAGQTLHFGEWRADDGAVLDEVVVALFRGPRSYTREDVVEISCHGSPYILRRILENCLEAGARMAEPGEFTLRAYLNGRIDLSQAEAVADLIASESAGAHGLAMHQMKGGISREIGALRAQLIEFASLIELELDFAEEDVEFADREKFRALVEETRGKVERLLGSFTLGNAIKRGIRTVIAGRPNAGKSTLLNAMLQEERAIVSDIAGTTRDTIEEVLTIDGVQFRLIDTAGIRDAQDQIEALGVERTMQAIAGSALLIYVFDVKSLSPDELAADIERLNAPDLPLLLVANKMDLNPYEKAARFAVAGIPEDRVIPVSAIHDMNVPHLMKRMHEVAIANRMEQGQTLLSSSRHYGALVRVRESLGNVLRGFDEGVTSDWIAMDVRQALHYLGEVTGAISTEDLLENIFSNFCIGK
jgi:tRNA modification GTPase